MNADTYFEILEPDETIQEQRNRLASRDNLRERMAICRAELGPYRPDPKTWQERLACYTKHMPKDPEAFRKWEAEGQQEYVNNLE